jgi:hypothetical protein
MSKEMSEEDRIVNNHLLQINTARMGLISGTLKEWPALHEALKFFGVTLSPDFEALYVCRLCDVIYSREYYKFFRKKL